MTFLVILFVFIVAYGVAKTSILSPKKFDFRALAVDVIFYPYLNVLGQIEISANQTDRKWKI